jgi:3-oxosteroid 1-dehydrogenase
METFDVVVLGTGAAGLTAALAAADAGASVGLFEKAPLIGGTTCLSSAVAWLPNNRFAAAAGVQDSREDALAYLESLSHGLILPEMAEAFVDNVAPMLDWLESRTPLHMRLVAGFPDYHPEHPGGKPQGGRSIEPELFSFDQLGAWADQLIGKTRPMMVGETPIGGGTGFLSPEVEAQRSNERIEGLGRAMVGALLRGCLDHGIEPVVNARARELVTTDGRVTGVRFDGPDGPFEVSARGGVVIATGGFEWDKGLVRDFLRGPMEYPATVPTNTGDGLRMAMKVGAMLGNMREAWWVPVCQLPGQQTYGEQAVYLVQRERTVPRSIMVNRDGVRFTNEASNYNALGGAFHQLDASRFDYINSPCWVVYDAGHVAEYGGFGSPPGGEVPSWITRASSLGELAELIGVPGDALESTVAQWNGYVLDGDDPDFGRGNSAFDGYVGDRRYYPDKGCTFGLLDTAPYYAVQLHSSTLGTKGGPRTNTGSAVLNVDGDVIPGLYAAGNAMAGPTGMVYGGAGGTLGPALVFGYLAGLGAAGATPVP